MSDSWQRIFFYFLRLGGKMKEIVLYDTTLRDGSQGERITFSAKDKLRIAHKLDEMGFHYIEGGWPGSNPKDINFFNMAKKEHFQNAKLVAFGSTRRPSLKVTEDPNLKTILESGTGTVCIFGKSWDFHVTDILQISLQQNIDMIYESVNFLVERGKEVIYDAEHFFDGYKANPEYTLKTLKAALEAGAHYIVLCDTNGGTLPSELQKIVSEVKDLIPISLGIHCHNDCELAVANSIEAVGAGVSMVQGTINGYGERCGNANLISIIPTLQIKMGYKCIGEDNLLKLKQLSHFVSEIANLPHNPQAPYVGKSAFAHKGGVHVSAILKSPLAYEHIRPEVVGNRRRVLISDLAGKSNVLYKAKELGLRLGGNGYDSEKIVQEVKRLEEEGYQFEAAEASFEVLVKRVSGGQEPPFKLESFRVIIEKNGDGRSTSQATIKIAVGEETEITAAEGDGPVNALDNALRKALYKFFPEVSRMHLVDFKVRVLDGRDGTAAKVKVLIDSSDEKELWSTIGVSENVIEASWQALIDSIYFKLFKLQEDKSTE